MTAISEVTVRATARDAGRNVVHIVSRSDGGKVYRATRRSATNRYRFAICRWDSYNGERSVVVQRWSNKPFCGGRDFAVSVEDI